MEPRDFVVLALLASGGEVQGNTKLQKTMYFLAHIAGVAEDLGYRPHFYGPYSDEVANAVTQLKTIGAIDQNVTDWGVDRSGFEVKRYDYRLNDAGRKYAEMLKLRHEAVYGSIRKAASEFSNAGDLDYMSLSIAAKTYFLLGQKKGMSTSQELAGLASRFGWNVTTEQVKTAARYLDKLKLVKLPSQ